MWRHIAGSVRGAAHEKSDVPRQDDYRAVIAPCAEGEALVACVADGAGSAEHSFEGARIACDAVVESAVAHVEEHGAIDGVDVDLATRWCGEARDRIKREASEHERTLRDYATTLSAAIVSPSWSVFFQVGDGAIVVRRDAAYGVVFWPQSGEYANSTNFLTASGFEEHLEFCAAAGGFADVALFTDGLERLALTFESQTAHAPFFQPLFAALRDAQDVDFLNEELRRFLTSDHVQIRSDDDKTVILATQVAGEEAAGR